jgi:hypothetical protein
MKSLAIQFVSNFRADAVEEESEIIPSYFNALLFADRRVIGYYSGESPEDALDMRKALPRDKDKRSIIPLEHPVYPEELEW